MYRWCSENDHIADLTDDECRMFGIQRLGDNAVIITENDFRTHTRYTGLLFVGPNSRELAEKWGRYVDRLRDANEEPGDIDVMVNTKTATMIREFLAAVKLDAS